MNKLIVITLIFFAIISCKERSEKNTNADISDYIDINYNNLSGDWSLSSIDNIDADSVFENIPHIKFDSVFNQLTGNSGCNNFSANVEFADNKIIINSIVTTRISCNDSDFENRFVTGLMDTSAILLTNTNLIMSKNNSSLFFVKR